MIFMSYAILLQNEFLCQSHPDRAFTVYTHRYSRKFNEGSDHKTRRLAQTNRFAYNL